MSRMGEDQEREWDKRLGIDTCGRVSYQEDRTHYPYEPTPYCVLLRLEEEGIIQKEDFLLDYGCGRGRVPLFFARRLGCRAYGVEYDPLLYSQAVENGRGEERVSFHLADAASLELSSAFGEGEPLPDTFFFFNPFGETTLIRVLDQIWESSIEQPRPVRLLFYYPDPDQVALLMGRPELLFEDEVDCSDLFPGKNERERVLIFSIL